MIDLAQLTHEGCTTHPVLDAAQVAAARRCFDALDVAPDHAFFASSNDLPRDRARAVHEALLEIVGPALQRLLPHHRPFLASFLSKGTGGEATVAYHQDLTYTDERRHRAVVAWIPLSAVDATSGALRAVLGSHRWTDGSRASGEDPLPTAPHQEAFGALAVDLPLEAGGAVLYDPGVVHGSPPNGSAAVRVAIGVALAPAEASLVHVHRGADGRHRAWAVDVAYHLDQGLRNVPVGYPEVPLWAPAIDASAFERPLAAASLAR